MTWYSDCERQIPTGYCRSRQDLLFCVRAGYLTARVLIVCGFTADNCALFTAADAHMSDYDLIIPTDCVSC